MLNYPARVLIKVLFIGASDKSSGNRRQSSSIPCDHVIFVLLENLTKQKTA